MKNLTLSLFLSLFSLNTYAAEQQTEITTPDNAVKCVNSITSRSMGPYTMYMQCEGGANGFAHNETELAMVEVTVWFKDGSDAQEQYGTSKSFVIEAPTSNIRDYYVIYDVEKSQDMVTVLEEYGIAVSDVTKVSGDSYYLLKGTKLYSERGEEVLSTI